MVTDGTGSADSTICCVESILIRAILTQVEKPKRRRLTLGLAAINERRRKDAADGGKFRRNLKEQSRRAMKGESVDRRG
jgi:hypothetical protein